MPTLLATFIGAGLALWAAMKVERAVEARAALATSRERREQLADLLSLLDEELQRNAMYLRAMRAELSTRLETVYSLSTRVWQANADLVLTRSTTSRSDLSAAYDRLDHCQAVLQKYTREVQRADTQLQAREQTWPEMQEAIREAEAGIVQAKDSLAAERLTLTT